MIWDKFLNLFASVSFSVSGTLPWMYSYIYIKLLVYNITVVFSVRFPRVGFLTGVLIKMNISESIQRVQSFKKMMM